MSCPVALRCVAAAPAPIPPPLAGLPSIDYAIVDAYIAPVEGSGQASFRLATHCAAGAASMQGRRGVQAEFTEGLVYLPPPYQINTFEAATAQPLKAATLADRVSGCVSRGTVLSVVQLAWVCVYVSSTALGERGGGLIAVPVPGKHPVFAEPTSPAGSGVGLCTAGRGCV